MKINVWKSFGVAGQSINVGGHPYSVLWVCPICSAVVHNPTVHSQRCWPQDCIPEPAPHPEPPKDCTPEPPKGKCPVIGCDMTECGLPECPMLRRSIAGNIMHESHGSATEPHPESILGLQARVRRLEETLQEKEQSLSYVRDEMRRWFKIASVRTQLLEQVSNVVQKIDIKLE